MDPDAIILAGGDTILGRIARRGGTAAARRGGGRTRATVSQQKVQRMVADLPSANGRVMRQFFGLPAFVFVNGGATTISNFDIVLRSFQMDRVILSRFNVGAASPNLAVTVTLFKVAAEDALVGGFGLPLDMFARDTTGAMFQGYTAKAGLPIRMALTISAAPAAGETVTVTFGSYGDSVAG